MSIEIDDTPFFAKKTVSPLWERMFLDRLGEKRFKDLCSRLEIKVEEGLKETDLAKLLIGAKDVKRRDMQEVLEGNSPPYIPEELSKECRKFTKVEELPSQYFHALYKALGNPFGSEFRVKPKAGSIEAKIEELFHLARSLFYFNPYWYAKQRGNIFEETMALSKIRYYERLACFYAASEDLEVGCYIPAPSTSAPKYYIVKGQLVTGGGQTGHFLLPATYDMDLPPIRLTRGTPKTPSELDFFSHLITDLEEDIGKMGYESGLPYEEKIRQFFPSPHIELGYSIGGTIAQWRVAHNIEETSELWIFKSPGVPKRIWEMFNQKAKESKTLKEIHIFQAKRDIVDLAGDHVLGYKSPSNIDVHLYEIVLNKLNTHRYRPTDASDSIIKEISKAEIQSVLEHAAKERFEQGRKFFGPRIGIPLVRFIHTFAMKNPKFRLSTRRGLWAQQEQDLLHWL